MTAYHDDGTRRGPLVRDNPYRYARCNQEDWPEPEETNLDAKEFAMLRDGEQDAHIDDLDRGQRRQLICDLALELQGRLVAEEKYRSCQQDQLAIDCECGDAIVPGVEHVCRADPTTRDLEAIPAAELAKITELESETPRELAEIATPGSAMRACAAMFRTAEEIRAELALARAAAESRL